MIIFKWEHALDRNCFARMGSENKEKQEPAAESHWADWQEQVEADRALGREHGWPAVQGDFASFVPAMRPLL